MEPGSNPGPPTKHPLSDSPTTKTTGCLVRLLSVGIPASRLPVTRHDGSLINVSASRPVKQALADLEARLPQAQASILAGLRPGLSQGDATKLIADAGLKPDPGLIALYTWHNGAEGGGAQAELMDTARFLSLQEAIETRTFELGLAAQVESVPDMPAAEIFDPGWFPILSDASGRIYVVEQVGAGRVLIVDRQQIGIQEELSPTLIGFIDSLAQDALDFKPSPISADVTVLVRNLESKDGKKRVSAIQELTRKRPAAAFEPLVAMLESDQASARRSAALILGLLHDRRAIPILIRCIARWSVRDAEGLNDATSAFAGLRDVSQEGWLAHLEHALADRDVELRLDAIKALAVSRDARAVPSLQAVAMHDSEAKVRAAAEQGLRSIGDPR